MIEEYQVSRKMPCLLPAIVNHVRFYLEEEQSFISVLVNSSLCGKDGGDILGCTMKGCK